MTPEQYAALEPGIVIERYSNRSKRVVVSTPRRTRGGGWTSLGLVKVGHSWTDPNPTAHYDRGLILAEYAVTDRRAPVPELARLWQITNGREREAALAAYYEQRRELDRIVAREVAA